MLFGSSGAGTWEYNTHQKLLLLLSMGGWPAPRSRPPSPPPAQALLPPAGESTLWREAWARKRNDTKAHPSAHELSHFRLGDSPAPSRSTCMRLEPNLRQLSTQTLEVLSSFVFPGRNKGPIIYFTRTSTNATLHAHVHTFATDLSHLTKHPPPGNQNPNSSRSRSPHSHLNPRRRVFR